MDFGLLQLDNTCKVTAKDKTPVSLMLRHLEYSGLAVVTTYYCKTYVCCAMIKGIDLMWAMKKTVMTKKTKHLSILPSLSFLHLRFNA